MQQNIRAAERLYLNEDGNRVLRKGEPGTFKLFRAQGQEITPREIERFQLDPATGIPLESLTAPTSPPASPKKPENPAVHPEENKMDTPDEAKEIRFGGGPKNPADPGVDHEMFGGQYEASPKVKKGR
jgi:hypothetical protein